MSTKEQTVRLAGRDWRFGEGEPLLTETSVKYSPEAFLALKQGKVQAVTTDESILVGIKNSDDKPEAWDIVGEYISPEPYGLGVAENDSDFRDFVNLALMDMWEKGEYQKIVAGVDYPAPFLWASTADDRTHPSHARKGAARLKELGQPYYYFEDTTGGHSGGVDNDQRAKLQALQFIYLMQRLMDAPKPASGE